MKFKLKSCAPIRLPPYQTDQIQIAVENFTLIPLYGARSFSIIIPEGITCTWEASTMGHANLYFMKDFELVGSFVPLYDDIRL